MSTTTEHSQPRSLAAWQARSLHTITCPSGQRLRIRIRGLATILEAGHLPDELINIALTELTHEMGAQGAIAKELAAEEITDEQKERGFRLMKEFGALQRALVCVAVEQVEIDGEWVPAELKPEDLDALPEDDLAMVAEIIQRLRGSDALGVRIGVAPLDDFATFREAHECAAEGCKGCEEVIRRFSSAHLGAV